MNTQEIFINNLKFYRKQAGFTQAQLAVLIDKSFNYINGIECGASFPPPDVIDKIAETLKIKPSQLFDETSSPENIKKFSKEEYINEISEKLFNNLKPFISSEIKKTLK